MGGLPPLARAHRSQWKWKDLIEVRRAKHLDLASLVVLVVVVLAFGPYLYSGARTEQVAIYVCLAAFAVRYRSCTWAFRPSPLPILFLLLFMVIVSIVALINAPIWLGQVPGDFLSAIDNSLLPIATIMLGSLWLLSGTRAAIIRNLCIATVSIMTLAAVISILQVLLPEQAGLRQVLQYFWTQSRTGSVAELALGNGRYTGIFNQPAEAGIAFGLGLFACIYLTRISSSYLILKILVLSLLLTGGLLAQSKVFYLVSLSIALVSMVLGRTQRWRVLGSGLVAVAVASIVLLVTGASEPLRYTGSFLNGANLTNLSGLTAGRFGGDGNVDGPLAFVLTHSPVYGFGIAYFGSANDSEWLRIFGGSGLLGLTVFTLVLAILAHRLIRNSTALADPDRWLAGSVLAITIVGSFGIPVLSANRAGTLVCLVLAVTLGGLHTRLRREATGQLAGSTVAKRLRVT
jgi:hypothetical protein